MPSVLLPARGIIFDLDGTLVDSAPDLVRACNQVLGSLDREAVSLEVGRRWIGNGAKRLVERALLGGFDGQADPDLLEKAYALFQRFFQDGV